MKMTVRDLKEVLNSLDDSLEVFIENSGNPVGNVTELYQVRHTTYGFFGVAVGCVKLCSGVSDSVQAYQTDDIPNFIKE